MNRKLRSALRLSRIAALVGLFAAGFAAGGLVPVIGGSAAGALVFASSCACLATCMNVAMAFSNLRMTQALSELLASLRGEIARFRNRSGEEGQ